MLPCLFVRLDVQKALEPPAIVYLMVYSLGYPIGVGALVFFNRLTIMEDQILTAKGTALV